MVKVDRELLRRVAKNARLNLTEKEIEILLPQFKEILEACRKISAVDIKGVEPAFRPVEIKNVFRTDKVEESLTQEQALANTKHKKNGYFKGPRVI